MRRAVLRVCVLMMSLLVASAGVTAGGRQSLVDVQSVVDDVRDALGLNAVIRVIVVDANPKLASVSPVRGGAGEFELSVELAFLKALTPAELRAVVAHELGHVWIYGNHPYLHTEQLANAIALRVVDRASLESAYRKVAARGGPDASRAVR
jgi:Zn-dependent protease with chaperone function